MRQSSKPIHSIDVRDLGDVEGCYAEGPNKFGFGISTSFNNGKLLIGSLKDYVHLVEFADGITLSTVIPNPIDHDHNDHNHNCILIVAVCKDISVSTLASVEMPDQDDFVQYQCLFRIAS